MTHSRIYTVYRKTKTKVLNVSTSLIIVASSMSGALPVLFSHQALALGATVTSGDLQGWAAQDGSPTFVAGPSGTDGNGSLKLSTGTDAKQNFFHAAFTPLASVTGLGYKVDVASGVPASYQLQVTGVHRLDSASTFTSLVWEPVYNNQANGPTAGFVSESNLENGIWWSSHPIDGDTQGNNGFVPLQQIIDANPGAQVVAYGVNVGSGTPNSTSYVDDVSFLSAVSNFEASPPAAPVNTHFVQGNNSLACGSSVNSIYNNQLQFVWNAGSNDSTNYRTLITYPNGGGIKWAYTDSRNLWLDGGNNGFGAHGDGVYTYEVEAKNANNLWSDKAAACSLTYDTANPSVTFLSPSSGSYDHDLTISATIDGTGSNLVQYGFQVTGPNGIHFGTANYKVNQPSVTLDNFNLCAAANYGTCPSTLPDGPYTIRATAYDAAGNRNISTTLSFNVDNQVPSTPALKTPVDRGYEKTNDFYFDWTDSTDNTPSGITYEFQSSLNPHTNNGVLDSDVWNSLASGKTLTDSAIHSTGAPDGIWYWQVRAIDAAGNKSAWTPVWHVTIDTAPPATTLDVQNLKNGLVNTLQHNDTLTLTGDASDNLGLSRVYVQLIQKSTSKRYGGQTVYLNGTDDVWQATVNAKSLGLADGDYYAVATVTDNAGNSVTTPFLTFTLDNEKPTIEFINTSTDPSIADGAWVNGDFQVSFHAHDNNKLNYVDVGLRDNTNPDVTKQWKAGCHFGNLNQSDVTETCDIKLPSTANLPDGTYTIQIGGQDQAGLWTVGKTRTVHIDRSGPDSTNDFTAFVKGVLTVHQHITDNLAPASGKLRIWKLDSNGNPDNSKFFAIGPKNVDNNDTVSYSFDTVNDLFGDGKYIAKFTSWDAAGNGTVQQTYFTVDNARPNVHITSPSDKSYETTSDFTVKGTASDIGGSGVDHVNVYIAHDPWSDGGYVVNNQPATTFDAATGDFTYDATGITDGTYVIKAVAYDKAGNAHFANTVHITVDTKAPLISDNFNISMLTGDKVALTPTVTGDTNVTYQWKVSDPKLLNNPNDTLDGATLIIGPAPKGDYTVTLTVSDQALNTSTATYNVTVSTHDVAAGRGADSIHLQGSQSNQSSHPQLLAANIGSNNNQSNGGGQVKGDSTKTPNTGVKGDSTDNSNSDTVNNSSDKKSGAFLGLGWWWLLVLAVAFAAIVVAANRSSSEADEDAS